MATFWLGAVTTSNGSAFVTVDSGDDINLIPERSLLQVETTQFVEVKRAFTDAGNVPTIELSQAWTGSAGSNRPAIAAPTAGNLAEAAERLRTLGDSATAILDNALLRDDNLAGLANAGTARGNLGLGDAAVKTVMSSLTDTTTGRLMPVGAFGLGNGLRIDGADLNTLNEPGLYFVNDATVDKPTSAGGTVIVSGGGGYLTQQFTVRSGSPQTWIRKKQAADADWPSTWTEIYTQESILGPVSQSGGVPTGAVIERGSNANGEYVKFADGTMICTAHSTETVTISENNVFGSTSGTTYRYTSSSRSFPASFVSPPEVTTTGGHNGESTSTRDVVTFNVTASGYGITFRANGSNESVAGGIIAVGRWF